jgi:hypothetical protein
MTMNVRRARQIIKQRNHTATLVLKILEAGPTDDRSLFEVLRKRGWKEGQGMMREIITALTVAGKVATRKGVHRLITEDEPVPQRPVRHTLAEEMQRAQRAHDLRTIGKQAALELPLEVLVAANNIMNEPAPERGVRVDKCTEDQKENDMDLSKLTPDQMLEMAAQMQKMAEAKRRELDPELLRQMLEAGQSVLDATDLLTEATERFRRAMNAVCEARGLPTTKKA